MRAASLSSSAGGFLRGIGRRWRVSNPEQRVAGVAATLLIVSTFGPFSFVELAIVLVGLAILTLLRARADGREFHLPFGDGAVIASAGVWCAVLIVVRVFDRPLGQNLLALGCALLLFLAGARERAKRPPDDLPTEPLRDRTTERLRRRRERESADWPTRPLADEATRPLPEEPPEMPTPGERRGGEAAQRSEASSPDGPS
jgi:hypothetical protein